MTTDQIKRRAILALVFLGVLPLPIAAYALGAFVMTRGSRADALSRPLLVSQLWPSFSSQGRQVTTGVGIASFTDAVKRGDELVSAAEEAFHAAVRAGNYRIAVWEGPIVGRKSETEVLAL